jgi:hypothetical protein
LLVLLLVIATAVTSAPIFATILVVVASRHEDARHSLLDQPPSRIDAAARRLVMLTRRSPQETSSDRPARKQHRPQLPQQRTPGDDLVGPSLVKPHA